jgi:hypothetical protein
MRRRVITVFALLLAPPRSAKLHADEDDSFKLLLSVNGERAPRII